ncbi:MAG: hypothetical protein KAT91_00940 [Candidatus Aenigmarchaeota archaeon]|nr:hypothetical protein [Candidatus Aenigmarchaeota archaeon]
MVYENLLAGTQENMSTKDTIIYLLSIHWPLTARKIHNKMRKIYKTHITYQSVHKTLKSLEETGVLEKNNKEYQINIDWIRNIQQFATKLENTYVNKLQSFDWKLIEESKIKSIHFDNIANLDRFILLFFEKTLLDKKRKDITCCSYWTHAWWPIVLNENNYSLLKKIINPSRFYMSFGAKSLAEIGCIKFFNKLGYPAKMGISMDVNYEFVVFDDIAIQIYFPLELNKKIEKIHAAKTVPDMDLNALSNIIFKQKYDITVIILKNKGIAEQLKSKVLENF